MYRTILISGAILIGGLYVSCASGAAKNNDATPPKPPPVAVSPDTPHPDIPPVIMHQDKTSAEYEAAVSRTAATLLDLKMPELYKKYVDMKTLEIMDYDTMLAKLNGIQVIYVAEAHTNEAHHNLQLNILKSLYKKNPKAVLAMEFLYRSKQESIDNYIADKITEEEFDKSNIFGFSNWYHYYLSLIRYAHADKIKILGLNVEKTIKSKMLDAAWNSLSAEEKAAKGDIGKLTPEEQTRLLKAGWETLSPDEQKLIARDIDTSNLKHKEFAMRQFQGMMNSDRVPPAMKARMDQIYILQCMWDETFGETIANYLKNANDPQAQVVVVLGAGHIEYKFNTPDRSYKRFPAPFKTLVPFEINENTPNKDAYIKQELSSGAGDIGYFSPLSPRE